MNSVIKYFLLKYINEQITRIKEDGMLSFIEGYKTYIATIIFVLRQVAKHYNYDVSDEHLSIAIDVFMGAVIALMRYLAKPKQPIGGKTDG